MPSSTDFRRIDEPSNVQRHEHSIAINIENDNRLRWNGRTIALLNDIKNQFRPEILDGFAGAIIGGTIAGVGGQVVLLTDNLSPFLFIATAIVMVGYGAPFPPVLAGIAFGPGLTSIASGYGLNTTQALSVGVGAGAAYGAILQIVSEMGERKRQRQALLV